jgi:nuclear GTP-binding protein
MVKRNGGGRSQ